MRASRGITGYAVAVAAVAVVTLGSIALRLVSARVPFALYFVAVLVAARYGGRGPGLLATGLSILAADYFIFPPDFAFSLATGENLLVFVVLASVAIVVSSTTAGLATARARAEAAEATERQQRTWLATTLASIGDAVITTDVQGRVTLLNREAENLTGWTQAEAAGCSLAEVFQIVDEQNRQPAENPAGRVLREGAVIGLRNHTLLIARDGTERPIDDSAAPIREPGGAVGGVVLVFRDVSRRRAAEREREHALERERAARGQAEAVELHLRRQAALLDLAHDAIFTHDLEGRITFWNRGAEELYGWSRDEAVGQIAHELLETEYPIPRAEIRAAIEAAGRWDGDLVHFRRDGQRLTVSSRWALQRDDEGRSLAILEITRDITERNQLLEDQVHARERVEEALRARDEFLSVAAHELRTPLTTMRAHAQLALRRFARDEQLNPALAVRSLRAVEEQSQKLARLVEQLLDHSRLEGGRLALERRETDLVALVEACVTAAQARTDQHQIRLEGPPSLCANVDELRLEQVLTNLLDNAIKYSPDGEIQLTLSETENGTAQIAVRDHGPGIPPGGRADIFERFHRAHTRDHASGMGLGLYISRQIVELHGGELRAEFPEDGGSRFVITLPLDSANA